MKIHFRPDSTCVTFASDNLLYFLQLVILFLNHYNVVVDGLFEDEKLGRREVVAAAAWLGDAPIV